MCVCLSLSGVWLFATPWATGCQASLFITNSRSLLKLMSTELVMPSNHLILCRPFLLLPSIFPSIRVFSNKLALCIGWPKYWSFSFNINPSNEYSELISFRIDWIELLAVQRTLKSLLQHQFSSVTQSCPTLCDPMNRSTPGLPVHQQLPEFTQTHVHWVGDAIQPSHPLPSPFSCLQSFPASRFFQLVSSSHQVAKVLEFQLQHQSFQWIFRTDLL